MTGQAPSAVNYLEEQDENMLVKGTIAETFPHREALQSNTKTLRSASQANAASDTGNLAQQNAQQTLNKACESKGKAHHADSMAQDKGKHLKDVVRCK